MMDVITTILQRDIFRLNLVFTISHPSKDNSMNLKTNGLGGGEPEPSTPTPGAHLDSEAEDSNGGTILPETTAKNQRRKPKTAGNSQAKLDAHAHRCRMALDRANRAGRHSLDAYREAGAELRKMKEIIKRGQFGAEVKKRCGCTRQWAARLMRLDEDWGDFEAALKWANGVGVNEFTVDSALALINRYRIRNDEQSSGREQPSPKPAKEELRTALSTAKRDLDAATKQHAAAQEVLKSQLAAANAYIWLLEVKIRSETTTSNPKPFEEGQLRRLEHVGDRWLRGATDNERLVAIEKLDRIARAEGWNLRELMRECGLEGKAHFPLRAPPDGPSHAAAA
jgi:hypothetical protein